MIPITSNDFIQMMRELKGAEIISLVSKSESDLLKYSREGATRKDKIPNPYQNNTFKINKDQSVIGFIYESTVNNRRLKSLLPADFEPLPRQWGERINETPLVYYDKYDKYYLETLLIKRVSSWYEHKGEKLSPAQIELFKPAPRIEGARQGLPQKKVAMLRDYTITNIRTITIDKQTYVIV